MLHDTDSSLHKVLTGPTLIQFKQGQTSQQQSAVEYQALSSTDSYKISTKLFVLSSAGGAPSCIWL